MYIFEDDGWSDECPDCGELCDTCECGYDWGLDDE